MFFGQTFQSLNIRKPVKRFVQPIIQLRSTLLDMDSSYEKVMEDFHAHIAPYKVGHHILVSMVMPYSDIEVPHVHKRKQNGMIQRRQYYYIAKGNFLAKQSMTQQPRWPEVQVLSWYKDMKLCPLTRLEQTQCLPE